jgi:hypothetical protein
MKEGEDMRRDKGKGIREKGKGGVGKIRVFFLFPSSFSLLH